MCDTVKHMHTAVELGDYPPRTHHGLQGQTMDYMKPVTAEAATQRLLKQNLHEAATNFMELATATQKLGRWLAKPHSESHLPEY